MQNGAISVGLLLLLAGLPAEGHNSSAASHLNAGAFVERVAPVEVAQDNYAQLRAPMPASLEVRVMERRKNPSVANGGLNPAILRTLDLQQTYLSSRPAHDMPKQAAKRLVPAFPCNGPMIRSVNGNREGVVFTPRAPGNVYAIEGCSFGNARGHVQLEARGISLRQPGLPIVLQLDRSATAWTEREIDVHLDPHLSGVPDSPVTLVIYASDGQRVELPGCFFVALRGEPRLLRLIPATWVSLHATTGHSRGIQQLEYVSPPVGVGEIPNDASGASALVIRSDSEAFTAGSDTYDFSQLGPGWTVESVQLQTYTIACPADISYTYSFGRWDVAWNQRGFTVSWEGSACTRYALPFPGLNLSLSQYAAKVWVIGPLGTEPVRGVLHR